MQSIIANMKEADKWYLEALTQPKQFELSDSITHFTLYRNESHPLFSETLLIDTRTGNTYGKFGYSINKKQATELRIRGIKEL